MEKFHFWFDFEVTTEVLESSGLKQWEEVQRSRDFLFETKRRISKYHFSKKNSRWNKGVCLIHPWTYVTAKRPKRVSRAFYKLAEILTILGMPEQQTALCLCEAPGGFVECLRHFYPNISWSAYSLPGSIPFSKKLPSSSLVYQDILEDLPDTTPVGIVTADGGIDCSEDYSQQETLNYPIIRAQVEVARSALLKGGTLVIKMFDLYTFDTFKILLWLCKLFETVNICKPPTSRPTNSEKYLVCRSFKKIDIDLHSIQWGNGIPEVFDKLVRDTADLQIDYINKVISQIDSPGEIDFSKIHQDNYLIYKKTYKY